MKELPGRNWFVAMVKGLRISGGRVISGGGAGSNLPAASKPEPFPADGNSIVFASWAAAPASVLIIESTDKKEERRVILFHSDLTCSRVLFSVLETGAGRIVA